MSQGIRSVLAQEDSIQIDYIRSVQSCTGSVLVSSKMECLKEGRREVLAHEDLISHISIVPCYFSYF